MRLRIFKPSYTLLLNTFMTSPIGTRSSTSVWLGKLKNTKRKSDQLRSWDAPSHPPGKHRPQQYPQVEPHRPVVDVVEVVLDARAHLVVGVGLAAEAVHLRPAGDAGQHVVAARIARDLLLVFSIVRKRVRARANQRHVALEHVDELRQLVDVPSSQEAAKAGDARVVATSLAHHVAVFERGHGAELDDAEFLLVEAIAPLHEEQRASAFEETCKRGEREHWREREP